MPVPVSGGVGRRTGGKRPVSERMEVEAGRWDAGIGCRFAGIGRFGVSESGSDNQANKNTKQLFGKFNQLKESSPRVSGFTKQ